MITKSNLPNVTLELVIVDVVGEGDGFCDARSAARPAILDELHWGLLCSL